MPRSRKRGSMHPLAHTTLWCSTVPNYVCRRAALHFTSMFKTLSYIIEWRFTKLRCRNSSGPSKSVSWVTSHILKFRLSQNWQKNVLPSDGTHMYFISSRLFRRNILTHLQGPSESKNRRSRGQSIRPAACLLLDPWVNMSAVRKYFHTFTWNVGGLPLKCNKSHERRQNWAVLIFPEAHANRSKDRLNVVKRAVYMCGACAN
jgi:hypothetical protein